MNLNNPNQSIFNKMKVILVIKWQKLFYTYLEINLLDEIHLIYTKHLNYD